MDSCHRYSAEPHHVLVGLLPSNNITLIITGPTEILVNRIYSIPLVPTSAKKGEERLQTAKLEARKLGSFVTVYSTHCSSS